MNKDIFVDIFWKMSRLSLSVLNRIPRIEGNSSNGIWCIFGTVNHLALATSLPYLLQNEVAFSAPALHCLFTFSLWWNMTSLPASDILWADTPVFTFLRTLPWFVLISSYPLPLEWNITSWITHYEKPLKKRRQQHMCDKFQLCSPSSRCHSICCFFHKHQLV